MKLELEFGSSYCYCPTFRINGIQAESQDFGNQYDDGDADDVDGHGCADMKFVPGDPTREILSKYGISEAEFLLVAGQLEAGLSFGNCGMCS